MGNIGRPIREVEIPRPVPAEEPIMVPQPERVSV